MSIVLPDDVKKTLYDDSNPDFSLLMEELEKATHLKREDLIPLTALLLAFFLAFSKHAATTCNLIGLAYPFYSSVLAWLRQATDEKCQWLTYWIVFAGLSIVDLQIGQLPLYWVGKCALLVWLFLPYTRGAQKLYNNTFHVVYVTISGDTAEAMQPISQGPQSTAGAAETAEVDGSTPAPTSSSAENASSKTVNEISATSVEEKQKSTRENAAEEEEGNG